MSSKPKAKTDDDEFERFKELTRKLIAVPKKELGRKAKRKRPTKNKTSKPK